MLKNIPKLLSSDLLKVLCDMGHGDDIAIVDANYPAERLGQKVLHYPGIAATELLNAIMQVFPLDHIVEYPVFIMELEENDRLAGMKDPVIWNEAESIISQYHELQSKGFKRCSRQEFYEKSQNAYVIVQTGEERLYGNFLLKKGVIS